MFSRRDQIAVYGFPRKGGGALVPTFGKDIYVNAQAPGGRVEGGHDDDSGVDWKHALRTMREALSRAKTGDRIFFTGKVQEQLTIADTGLTDLNLKFDITIQGVGGLHHADQPGSGTDLYVTGASEWGPASTPETTTPLLAVYGRGWKFIDVLFEAPADAACVELNVNASSGTDEYSASHARFYGCQFRNGLYGIQDKGGVYNILVEDCDFETMDATTSGAGIIHTNVVNAPRKWTIRNCRFQADCNVNANERHIIAQGLQGSFIYDNIFGVVNGTGLYIDLSSGKGNIVTGNYLQGDYDTSDYKSGTADGWSGNITADISGNSAVDASGITIAVPAAP